MLYLYNAYILQAVKSARAAGCISLFSLSPPSSLSATIAAAAALCRTKISRRRAALIECRRCVCRCTSERAPSHYGRLLKMSRMQPRVLAREDGGETEKNREEERKRRAETMTAARHDRIVILSRMAHTYARPRSSVRCEMKSGRV